MLLVNWGKDDHDDIDVGKILMCGGDDDGDYDDDWLT